jgi:hypothetical protein
MQMQMAMPTHVLKPVVRSSRFVQIQRQSRRTYADKAAPVRPDAPRDWTSRLPL